MRQACYKFAPISARKYLTNEKSAHFEQKLFKKTLQSAARALLILPEKPCIIDVNFNNLYEMEVSRLFEIPNKQQGGTSYG
ncbi:hypothetical protein [Feifania hominis]|uniref:Uncharacterized protein n=1 Tax=Feifania hominis TaxID=2763660 RepID=A0A926DFB8_9FIRM|nr:hypothetical protein [Feifania hominis]MBC8536797.1 hypothetical protein [Feifania hominis]